MTRTIFLYFRHVCTTACCVPDHIAVPTGFLCPVRALRYYLQRTRTHHRAKRRLFISVYESYDRDFIKNTIFSLDSYYNTTDLQKLGLAASYGSYQGPRGSGGQCLSRPCTWCFFHGQDHGSGILEEPRYIYTLLLAGCSCTPSGWILRYRQHGPGSGCYRVTARISHIMLLWFDRQVLLRLVVTTLCFICLSFNCYVFYVVV